MRKNSGLKRREWKQRAFYLCVLAICFVLDACSGCKPAKVEPSACTGLDCEPACPNKPKIIRTEFDPKEGRVPLDVTFNVKAEDEDAIVCGDLLTYHYDFDGDGVEDKKSQKGRATFRYKKSGKYNVKIWATDSFDHVSNVVNKFVVAGDNLPPYIWNFLILPYVGTAPFDVNPSWSATDNDGALTTVRIDYGDGTIHEKAGNITGDHYQYLKPGQYTVTLTVIDDAGAEAHASAQVVVVIDTLPSSFLQTVGSSRAIALNDNDGQYWTDEEGPYMYGYVADGAIALKTVKYPLSAFSLTGVYTPSKLIGWADPSPNGTEFWTSVVNYKNITVVAGNSGFEVFNVNTDLTRKCTSADYLAAKARAQDADGGNDRLSQHCYPGTPTEPVAICGFTGSGVTLGGKSVLGLQLFYPSTRPGEVWVVGNTTSGAGVSGGFQFLRLDSLQTDDYYVDPNCPTQWMHAGYQGAGNNSLMSSDMGVMVVDGDYGYVPVKGGGFYVVDLAGYLSSGALNTVFQLNLLPEYYGLQTIGIGAALARSRAIDDVLNPADFKNITSIVSGGYGDCDETLLVTAAASSVDVTEAVLAGVNVNSGQAATLLPGNRVAIQFSSQIPIDDNGGAGYRVSRTTPDGKFAIEYAAAPTQPIADWQAIYPIPVSYGVLPAYPGRNAVAFTTSQSASLALNSVCRNFINAYAPVTEAVGVQYASAPLGFVSIDGGTSNQGILVYDQSNPSVPEILRVATNRTPENMLAHDNYLYLSGGNRGGISVVDFSDPYHIPSLLQETGTYCQQSCSAGGTTIDPYDFGIYRLQYVTTPTNPKGVLLVPDGQMGLSALYVADDVTRGTLSTYCPSKSSMPSSNQCFQRVLGLQLQHEGLVNDIHLVGARYALVAQKRGGVLVFDISGIPYGTPATFVSHIRTAGDPRAVRVVTGATGAPQTLWIADNTGYYRIPFTDPAHPPISVAYGVLTGSASEYNCVEYTNGKVFLCYSQLGGDGFLHSLGVYAEGDNLPAIPMRFEWNDATDHCVSMPGGGEVSPGFLNLSTAVLAGRFFMFAETSGYGGTIRELKTDSNGNVTVDGSGAFGCQWVGFGLGGQYLSYQERTGPQGWKRLYTVSLGGDVTAYDIDGYEQELATAGFDTHNYPAKLGKRSLRVLADVGFNTDFSITRVMALGPYVFVAAAASGAFVIDATSGENMQIIGQTSISTGGIIANTLNVFAYPMDPNNPDGQYTYLLLVSDSKAGGGIRLIRFPNLEKP